MAEKAEKNNASAIAKGRRRLGASFDALSGEMKASSRRMQVYGEVLLKTITEAGLYFEEPLCSRAGAMALKNALRFYNVGVTLLKEPFTGTSDLDGLSEEYKAHVDLGVKLFDDFFKIKQFNEKEAFHWQVFRDVMACHHERWNGAGYPQGLKGNEIPLAARICAVCNELEYLTSANAERDKMTTEAAAEEISRRSETYYDPLVVQALNQSVDKINEILENGTVAKATVGTNSVRAIEQLYRLVYDYENHTPFGYDTDMRLNDSELGVMSSRVFLPIAEKSQKINELLKWSVEEACNTVLHLKKRNRFSGEFFLFLSAKSLTKQNFIENIVRIVEKSGVAPKELCFVISANIFSVNIENVATALNQLHEFGFQLAIGGFGAESVNLSVLQKLEVDYIFLNPDFVADILISPRAKQIVGSVIELGKKINVEVIADGVVNKQQAKELYSMGCNIMCGPYYGRFTAVTII